MSGSSTGPSSYGGGPSKETDCELLAFEVGLASPQASVVTQVQVGDSLEVVIDTSGTNPTIAVMKDADALGAIIGSRMEDLYRCIQEGHNYQAEVLSLDGGDVQVRITHA